jgi:hypothetical protein
VRSKIVTVQVMALVVSFLGRELHDVIMPPEGGHHAVWFYLQ